MMAVMVMMHLARAGLRSLLEILLHIGEVLLRCLQVSGLQIVSQLRERLHRGDAAVGVVGRRAHTGQVLGERREILLRLRQVAGLQILPQLLKFRRDLPEFRRRVLRR